MRRGALAAALAALALAAGGSPAAAAEVSPREFLDLAEEALDDPAALRELRAVDRVGAQRVDVDGALGSARGAELEARLRTLAADPAGEPRTAAPARADARDILSEGRFHETDYPRPLQGVFRQLGEWLEPVREALDDAVDALADLLPGGEATVWSVLAVLVLVLAAAAASRLVRRGARGREEELAAARALALGDDPAELERRAEEAERRGDGALAVRLRFRAGLLRLDARRAIALRPSLTTGEVARTLRSEDFDRLARSFDAIAYGGREAGPAEVEEARSRWPRVVEGAPRR